MGTFPYVDSYTRLIAAELRLLAAPGVPLLVRDRDAAHSDGRAQRVLAELRAELAQLPMAALPAEPKLALLGCGPLPITGFMWHAQCGGDVVMIDRDARSVARATALTRELERLGVLRPGAVRVVQAAGSELRFVPPQHPDAHTPEVVSCDVLLIASLVDHPTKLGLARALCADPQTAGLTLLLRSAAGLCGALAYEPVRTEELSELALPFCGESVPKNLVFSCLDAATGALRGVTTESTRELLVTAHPSVLKTTELYRRLPLPAAGSRNSSRWDYEALHAAREHLRRGASAPAP
ncbi:MAG: hypothetical protein ABW321_12535 [Polyangiales bacterium]